MIVFASGVVTVDWGLGYSVVNEWEWCRSVTDVVTSVSGAPLAGG